jgi:hypothetical protein
LLLLLLLLLPLLPPPHLRVHSIAQLELLDPAAAGLEALILLGQLSEVVQPELPHNDLLV